VLDNITVEFVGSTEQPRNYPHLNPLHYHVWNELQHSVYINQIQPLPSLESYEYLASRITASDQPSVNAKEVQVAIQDNGASNLTTIPTTNAIKYYTKYQFQKIKI
jgi:hypothetical protein